MTKNDARPGGAARLPAPARLLAAALLLAAVMMGTPPARAQEGSPPPEPTPEPPAALDRPGSAAANAAADSTGNPAGTVAADSTDALADYLGGLSRQTNDEFLLRQLSIDDAAVDSLIRQWEATGEAPATLRVDRGWEPKAQLGALRYNRVEGVNVMGDASLSTPGRNPAVAFARVGLGWASGKATWRGGVRTPIPYAPAQAALELAHARDVMSYGSGGVPGNSFLALTVGRDLDDYFLADGFTATLSALPGPLAIDASFSSEHQSSLPNETRFTLFEEGDRFRPNPRIDAGRSHRVTLAVAAGDAALGRLAGRVQGGMAGRGLGGDFEYETLSASVTARQRLWFGDELKVKLGGGLVSGEAPFQGLHFLGGTTRLRGYDINEFGTRQAAHLSLDYALGTHPLSWVPYVRRLRIQPVPFFDAGALFERQLPDGTIQTYDRAEWRFDAGVGLQYNAFGIPGGAGQVRLDVARRLDRGEDNMTYRLGFTLER